LALALRRALLLAALLLAAGRAVLLPACRTGFEFADRTLRGEQVVLGGVDRTITAQVHVGPCGDQLGIGLGFLFIDHLIAVRVQPAPLLLGPLAVLGRLKGLIRMLGSIRGLRLPVLLGGRRATDRKRDGRGQCRKLESVHVNGLRLTLASTPDKQHASWRGYDWVQVACQRKCASLP